VNIIKIRIPLSEEERKEKERKELLLRIKTLEEEVRMYKNKINKLDDIKIRLDKIEKKIKS
jgi:hypothetical protein